MKKNCLTGLVRKKQSSYLEQAFGRAVIVNRLPMPVREYQFFRYRFDFAWPKIKVAVEVDGEHHKKGAQLRSDKKKDKLAKEYGWVVLRADRSMVNSREFSCMVKAMIKKRINDKKRGMIS